MTLSSVICKSFFLLFIHLSVYLSLFILFSYPSPTFLLLPGNHPSVCLFILFFLIYLFLYWRIIALQNFVFCQTSTWISHRYTFIPSLLNPPPISLPIPPLQVETEPLVLVSIDVYRCESWTIKKAECLKMWCFWTVVLEKTLESLLANEEIKPVNPKVIGRTLAEAEAPILLPPDVKSRLTGKDLDAGKDWRKKEKRWQRIRWLDSITNSMDMNLSKLQEIVEDRGAGMLQFMGSRGVEQNLSDWITANYGCAWIFKVMLMILYGASYFYH